MHEQSSLGIRADIRLENGRWVVYLCATFWDPVRNPRLETVVRRIRDYPSRRQAEVAAGWMERAADRNLPPLSE
jgi:hypothetical protein